MKAFQIAALLLSSRVLGAPTGPHGGDAVSGQNPAGSDSVTPTGDAASGDETDSNFTPPADDLTANAPTETEEEEEEEDQGLTVTSSEGDGAGSEADSEGGSGDIISGDSGDTAAPDDRTHPEEDSGGSTGENALTDDTVEDTSGDSGSKGFRSVLYFTNWSVPTYNISHRNLLTLLNRGIYSDKYKTQPQDIPVDKVTHLLYAFADIKPDGEV